MSAVLSSPEGDRLAPARGAGPGESLVNGM